ncbi:MAG: transglutaminase-like domain-containing protein [Bacteroidales bacterium]|jgi:hypothetical protein|nr:transglutaminase-like domain-containing protein [Bacteroidales bacterium]
MKRFLLLSTSIIIVLASCRNNNDFLQESLDLANENREELEKVLNHYAVNEADSLKYQASTFLICNMAGKNSLDTSSVAANQPYFDALVKYLDRYGWYVDMTIAPVCDSVKAALGDKLQLPAPAYSANIKTVNADFLIKHIDRSFEVWKKYKWAENVTFEQFCRYVLPYNAHQGIWEGVFPYYEQRYAFLADTFPGYTAKQAGDYIIDAVTRDFAPGESAWKAYPFLLPANFRNIVQARIGECADRNSAAVAALRSVGIPAVLNQVPYWGNSNAPHFWTEIPVGDTVKMKYDNTQKPFKSPEDILVNDMYWMVEPVDSQDISPKINIRYSRTAPKVYRIGYEIQCEALPFRTKEEIPTFFQNFCLQDITEKYIVCRDTEVRLQNKNSENIAYLCCYVPENLSWTPVAWAEIKNGKAKFKQLGIHVLYLPAYYKNGIIVPAGEPFILYANGRKQTLIPDKNKRIEAEFFTKVPYRSHVKFYAEILKGGTIGISNKANLSDSVVLHRIEKTPFYEQIIDVNNSGAARYAYFYFTDKRYGFLAELSFYGIDENGKEIELKGKPIGNKGVGANNLEKIFDKDRVSYFYRDMYAEKFIGVDFGKPVTVKKIVFCPRSDDNGINPDEEYELFYWDGGWQSLGKQRGRKDYRLVYDNVPENALLRIHNHSRGKENRPFLYKNGKQEFW